MNNLKSKVCQFLLGTDGSRTPDEDIVSGICEKIRANVVHYFHHSRYKTTRIINNRKKLQTLQLQLE